MNRTLLELPREVISDNLFCYLDYGSLCSVAQSCKELRICAHTEQNWKALCYQHWLDVRQSRSKVSWRENFIEWFKTLGRYIEIYPEIKRIWNRIFNSLKERAPLVYKTLMFDDDNNEPSGNILVDGDGFVPTSDRVGSERDLKMLEQTLSRSLPEEFRCSYRICNGQNIGNRIMLEHQKYGMLGMFSVYHYALCEVLLPIHCIIARGSTHNQSKLIHFTSRHFFSPGQSTHIRMGSSRAVCLVDSGDLKAGNVIIQMEGDESSPGASFVYAKTFTEYLGMVATNLENPDLIVEKDGTMLQFLKEPGCEVETYHVKVSVATVLVPEFSQLSRVDPRVMFAYRITMSMDENEDPKYECILQARHWEIVEYRSETDRHTETVDGPGVIGEFPRIAPGVSFSYASWTPMKTPQGHMEGHFAFVGRHRDDVLQVVCPRFKLRCPEVRNFTFNRGSTTGE